MENLHSSALKGRRSKDKAPGQNNISQEFEDLRRSNGRWKGGERWLVIWGKGLLLLLSVCKSGLQSIYRIIFMLKGSFFFICSEEN